MMIRNLILAATTLAIAAPASSAETVAVPAFRSVELAGGGEVLVRPGAAQRVTIVNGSTSYTRIVVDKQGKLRIDACSSHCPRNYSLKIVIESPNVPPLAIHGGGDITASAGFASQGQLAVAIHGGGTIDARNVSSDHVSAAVSGGGNIKVRPLSSLSAAIRGGGEIAYSGNPSVSSAVTGGGALTRIR